MASAALSVTGILAAVWAAFVGRQLRRQAPLVDVRAFRSAPFSSALAANAAAMFVTYGTFFFTAQFLQLVAGLSPLRAGLWGLPPVAAMMVCAGGVMPALSTRVRSAFLIAGGMVLSACGLLALSQLRAGSGAGRLAGLLTVVVVGLSPVTTLGLNLVIGSAPPEQAGSVAGLGQAVNELGGALGIAVLGTLGTAVYRHHVDDTLTGVPDGLARQAGDTLGAATALAGQLPGGVLDAARAAFTTGLSTASTVGAAVLLVVAAVSALALRSLAVPSPASSTVEPAAAVGPREQPLVPAA